jgi:hypothetical protein
MKSCLTFALCLAVVAPIGVAAAGADPLASPAQPPAASQSLQQGMTQMQQAVDHAESFPKGTIPGVNSENCTLCRANLEVSPQVPITASSPN